MEDEFLDLFISELDESVKILNNQLLRLEEDSANTDAINEVMRLMHTVKGMAATMNYEKLTRLSHVAESKLIEIQRGEKLTENLIHALFQTVDQMKISSNLLSSGKSLNKLHVDDLIETLENYQEGAIAGENAEELEISEEEIEVKLANRYNIKVFFSESASLLGARGFQVLRILDEIATIESSKPDRGIIEEGNLVEDPEFEIISNEDEVEIQQKLSEVPDVVKIEFSHLVEESGIESDDVVIQRGIQSVRVSLSQLDKVVDYLGELVLVKNRLEVELAESLTPESVERLNTLELTISNIQEIVMNMRLVNLSRIFETYPRAVRDIAKSRGIQIATVLRGSHLEIDRSVIDQVNEALIHLIRNAATHGIEEPEIRSKLNKRSKGEILISAEQDRGEIVFIVEDDGGGLNAKKIREEGIKKGIITTGEKLKRKEILELIFEPGFSTASELTDKAGRGVGMNIVKESIEEITGSFEFESKEGEGTKFILRVPQTVAIVNALVIRVFDSIFAIPMINIEKIYSLQDEAIKQREEGFYLDAGSDIIKVVDLEKKLDIPRHLHQVNSERKFKKAGKAKVVLWKKSGKQIAMKVTDVLEQREVVTKTLDNMALNYSGYSSATILDQDQVVLFVDPAVI